MNAPCGFCGSKSAIRAYAKLNRQADAFFRNSADMKTGSSPVLIAFALVCFVLAQNTQAVNPPPDGGYGPPAYGAGNTAEGQNALLNLTTGKYNTAVGLFSLESNTTGNFNTAVGAGTLLGNATDNNTATGAGALLSNTGGTDNTANGAFALFFNTTGSHNTAVGDQALLSNTTGSENTATGLDALAFNTTGMWNTAIGSDALFNTTGLGNTGVGFNALSSNTTGPGNVAVGFDALSMNTTGVDNIALGDGAGMNVTTATNVICIGAGVAGSNADSSCYIGNIFGQSVDPASGTTVYIDGNLKLGTLFSSRRFKHDIKPMDKASEALFALKPVTFHYNSDAKSTPCFGLIAEEVAAVNPDLVMRDKSGDIYTVRYDAVNAMLLNEFLKEHKKTEKLEATVASLIATVKEQAAQIQKVSAQLGASKPAPQVVNNP
jgi:hypothetical protein